MYVRTYRIKILVMKWKLQNISLYQGFRFYVEEKLENKIIFCTQNKKNHAAQEAGNGDWCAVVHVLM